MPEVSGKKTPPSWVLEQRARIRERAEAELEYLEDGYLYYFPKNSGGLASYHLRIIADLLDERNAEWDSQIQEFFQQQSINEEVKDAK